MLFVLDFNLDILTPPVVERLFSNVSSAQVFFRIIRKPDYRYKYFKKTMRAIFQAIASGEIQFQQTQFTTLKSSGCVLTPVIIPRDFFAKTGTTPFEGQISLIFFLLNRTIVPAEKRDFIQAQKNALTNNESTLSLGRDFFDPREFNYLYFKVEEEKKAPAVEVPAPANSDAPKLPLQLPEEL